MSILKKILLHIFCWLVYIFIIDAREIITKPEGIFDLCLGLTSYSILAFVFYVTLFAINPWFLSKDKYWQTASSFAILFFVYNFFRVYQLRFFFSIQPPAPHPISFITILWSSFSYYLTNGAFFICFFLWRNAVALKKQVAEKERHWAEQKILNIQNELNFLQAQINPHFLFNTLNLFYVRLLPNDTDTANGILYLAEIMRYALKHPYTIKKNMVPLIDEISQIQNVVAINSMRLKGKMYLDFKVDGNPENIYVPPFILITLLENLFKHGAVHDPIFPSTVSLQIDEAGVLEFSTYNKKIGGLKDPSTGIGLDNIKKRLDFIYQDKYTLETNDDGIFYSTKLIMDTSAVITP